MDQLAHWNSIAGLQFENLVYNHLDEVLNKLNINSTPLISAGPYLQKKKTRNKGGCQIDLMIICKHKTIYLCEIKFTQLITKSIIKDVEKKISVLENAKKYSIRPVLIYAHEIDKNSENDLRVYFDKLISFADLVVPENFKNERNWKES